MRIVEYRLLLASHKKQMVAHAQKFGLFADVEMITQILLIGSFDQAVDKNERGKFLLLNKSMFLLSLFALNSFLVL